MQPIAIYYEHPEWFKPLFAELERRGVAYEQLPVFNHQYDPAETHVPYSLIFNRMSPSAATRGHADAIPYTLQYLAYLEQVGANVLHGYQTYQYEFSKALQLGLMARLGIAYPKARVFHHPAQVLAAAEGLQYPLVTKPNIGGSGAGIIQFNSRAELAAAAEANTIDMGLDNVALVQERLVARGNSIVRVEVLNGEFLYAIKLELGDTFNLCPADYCEVPDSNVVGSNPAPLVEGYTPPQAVIDTVLRLTKAANIEVGGVEYLVNDVDGEIYYYDINAMSNFVADAPNVIGFDPFPNLVDFVLARAGVLTPEMA